MTTKTLSDKIQTIGYMKQWIKDEDVKEFVKGIINLRNWYIDNNLDHEHTKDCIICKIIDDLQDLLNKAGDKLNEN